MTIAAVLSEEPQEPLEQSPRSVLAVDFGTATTYLCKCPGDQLSPQGVHLGGDRDGLATAILYRQEREPLVGDEALEEFGEATEKERRSYVLRTQFKPDITVSAEAAQASRDFLAGILREAQRQHLDLAPENRDVLFGVPSEANTAFRAMLRNLAQEAGYGAIRTVDEPLGALIYHVFHQDLPARDALRGLLVVDFGGGTCDFAFLQQGTVTASWGDMALGGRLFDDLIFSWLLDRNPGLAERLHRSGDEFFVQTHLCREIKEAFSRAMARDRSLPFSKAARHHGRIDAMTWEEFLSRARTFRPSEAFRRFQIPGETPSAPETSNLLERFRQSLRDGLRRGHIDQHVVRFVVLAGGSSQWPFVPDILHEELGIGEDRLMRSDRPNAAIAEGLALLPALQRAYQKGRKNIRDDLPRFRAQELEPLGNARVIAVARELARDSVQEFFDGFLLPLLQDFRQEGGSLGTLRHALETQIQAFSPHYETMTASRATSLAQALPLEMGACAETFFRHHGFRLTEDRHAPAQTLPLPLPKTPEVAEELPRALEALILALFTGVGAAVSGGGGMALLAAGPLGLAAGAGLGLAAGWALLTCGRERSRAALEELPLPSILTKALLGEGRLSSLRHDFENHLAESAITALTPMVHALVDHETHRIEHEIDALSELQRL